MVIQEGIFDHTGNSFFQMKNAHRSPMCLSGADSGHDIRVFSAAGIRGNRSPVHRCPGSADLTMRQQSVSGSGPDFSRLPEAAEAALAGQQLQPVLLPAKGI